MKCREKRAEAAVAILPEAATWLPIRHLAPSSPALQAWSNPRNPHPLGDCACSLVPPSAQPEVKALWTVDRSLIFSLLLEPWNGGVGQKGTPGLGFSEEETQCLA